MNRVPALPLCFALFAFAIALPNSASACSCVPPGPVLEERDRSTLVFVGTVDDIAPSRSGRSWLDVAFGWILDLFSADQPPAAYGDGYLQVTFDVAEMFQGPPVDRLRVTTHADEATCGYGFREGASYVVYASGDRQSPVVSLCSRTAPVSGAAEDLAILQGAK